MEDHIKVINTELKVKLLGHTQLAKEFLEEIEDIIGEGDSGKAISLSAIRTCYSPNKPSEIVVDEGEKYFKKEATDGLGGSEADRLIRHIVKSKHTSTLEHLTFTFSIEGISRACLAQLTRHRFFSFSVQSQRYVKFSSDSKSEGFDYIIPDTVMNNRIALEYFISLMDEIQEGYDYLRDNGIPAEDCRAILPNAASTNLTMTANLRSLLDFYSKRKAGRGGQLEITRLAEELKNRVVEVEPWTKKFFEEV